MSTIDWNEPNPLVLGPELPGAGAADVPMYFTSPARGKRDTLIHRFFRAVWEPYRGLVPERVQRRAEQFFQRVHEARALLDLRSAAESLTFTTRTSPSYGKAAQVRKMADKYLNTFQTIGVPS